MATVTPGKVFDSNEVVTPVNLNALGVPTVALANSEVTTAKIADANVTTAKIADGAVTQDKLNAGVTLVPTGAVMPFARSTAPSGWLIANGDTVPNGTGTVQGVTTDFTALYAAVGNNFGGLGKLPDLRGMFVRGSGTQVFSGTTYSKTFALKETDSVGPHTHSGTTGNDSPDHTHSYSNTNLTGNVASGGGVDVQRNSQTSFDTGGASTRHTHPFTTSSQSPAGTTETRPANIALLYCIKF